MDKFYIGKVYLMKGSKGYTFNYVLILARVSNFYNAESLPGYYPDGEHDAFMVICHYQNFSIPDKRPQQPKFREYSTVHPRDISDFEETPLNKAKEIFPEHQQLFLY